jgi:hypothetical protein
VRILIDECLDWRLCRALIAHQCSSVRQAGWSGLANRKLLKKAAQEFDVFLTGDRNSSFQQSIPVIDIAVVILEARSTRLFDTLKLIPQVLTTLSTIQPGEVVRIRAES